MKKILYGLSIALLGAGLLSCSKYINRDADGMNPDGTFKKSAAGTRSGTRSGSGSGTSGTGFGFGTAGTPDAEQSVVIKEALEEVVKVLHAPYAKGDLFFKIFKGTTEINETQNTGNTTSGSWTVKAGAYTTGSTRNSNRDKKNRIVYTYTDYKSPGSAIIVNGKMESMHRTQSTDDNNNAVVDAIGFNVVGTIALDKAMKAAAKTAASSSSTAQIAAAKAASQIAARDNAHQTGVHTLVDTLNITGTYNATLTFTYPVNGIDSIITVSNYDEYLFGDVDGIFTGKGSSVAFTYADETIELNAEQLKTLLHVAE